MKKLTLSMLVIIVLVAVGAWYSTRIPSTPLADVNSSELNASELIAKGEYVARASDCVACHTLPDSPAFSGGLEMATPIGSIYSTNITPDKTHGIGHYTLADFERVVRQGVAPDGHRLYPAMPFPSYAKLSDDDVKALYAYFMHGVQPSDKPNKQSEIPWPLNMRWPLAFWSGLFTDSGSYQSNTEQDEQWNRGAYLVQGAGHCGSCHTPRGLAMQEKALDESSPQFLAGALLDGWYAPSLRNDVNTGIGRWSEEDVYQFLKNGRNQHAVVYGSMTDAYNNSTQFMSDEDLYAMAHYLKSLPGDPLRDGEPWQHKPTTVTASMAAQDAAAKTYLARCSSCHGTDGMGRGQYIPPLAGATSMLAKEDASAINVTLNGSGRIVSHGVPDAYRMPPFRQQLSDKEIAEVLSFIRTTWGNHGGAVKVQDVTELREKTDPASSQVIILQMR
ncbi:cytochrome c [Shewanella sp. C32]|uniref:Cytochrome c n=1 Tax=Shewanella electrica TaxID=515560 RepID=A0ABT2FIG3_9GAMM|nr:cytochrome c [Shewanella electrica]MCH1924140.1 cytochrome c [Shewanella electrica]MCS4556043.1 cytochrome c [Shewanella electrica]